MSGRPQARQPNILQPEIPHLPLPLFLPVKIRLNPIPLLFLFLVLNLFSLLRLITIEKLKNQGLIPLLGFTLCQERLVGPPSLVVLQPDVPGVIRVGTMKATKDNSKMLFARAKMAAGDELVQLSSTVLNVLI